MDKKTLKDLIICAILVIVFGFLLSYAFEPEPVEYVAPAVTQDDVMALYKSQLDKAEKDLNKEIIKRAVAGEHIKEANEY